MCAHFLHQSPCLLTSHQTIEFSSQRRRISGASRIIDKKRLGLATIGGGRTAGCIMAVAILMLTT